MIKLEVKFGKKVMKQMDRLMRDTGIKSYTNLIMKALSLLNFLVKERVRGGKLIIRYGDKEKEIGTFV